MVRPLGEKHATAEQKESPEFKEFMKKFTSHKTRYLYGNISYLVYAKPKNIPLETYIQGQLGHLSGDSTKSYLGVNVKFREKLIKDVNPGTKEYIDTIQKKVTELEKNIGACCDDQIATPSGVNITPFKNSFSRKEDNETKINKVIAAIQEFKKAKAKLPTQAVLGRMLGYGGKIMSLAYTEARKLELISNYNVR
jgi:hypothetical protein